MSRRTRWLVAVTVSVAAFVVSVWLVRVVPFGWLPSSDDARWGIAAAFGAAVATAVGGAVNWWAGRSPVPPGPPAPAPTAVRRRVEMTATASDGARVLQAGRDLRSGNGGTPYADEAPDDVVLRAEAGGGARITQAGRDRVGGENDDR